MNRYFLYLVLLNMMVNVIIFVPKILIQYRYEGAVMAIIIAIPLGLMLNYFYCTAINKFPGQGLPEILSGGKHQWFKIIHLGSIQILWFSAGLITLIGFTDIIQRFINPEMPNVILILIYLAAIFLIIQMPTQRVMYLLEIILILNTPLLSFIIFKALVNDYITWDSILEVGTYLFERPNLKSIAAATYCFSGYTNLIIFNRVIKGKLKIWNFAAVLLLSIFNLFTTFFIPIGFFGSDGAQEYLYPWISTSDSLRLVHSPIERVIFLFLMYYMSITLISISVNWHVSYELIKGTFKEKINKKMNWLILAIFSSCAIAGGIFLNTVLLIKITVYWMIIRLSAEILLVGVFFIWARRRTA